MKIDKDCVVIVSGGSSGLGLGAVRLLASLGAKIVIADINSALGEKIAEEVKGSFFKVDVTDEERVKAMYEFTKKTYGKVSAVINSAGVLTPEMLISKKGVASTGTMERALKINVVGSFNVAKYAAKMMSEQPEVDGERGAIIMVGSIAGEGDVQRGQVVYAATKGAINGMVMPMARDLGKYKIRVMVIAPGPFKTPMGDGIPKWAIESMMRQIPLNRFGDPKEFGEVAKGMLENPYATGGIWRIDGAIKVPYL